MKNSPKRHVKLPAVVLAVCCVFWAQTDSREFREARMADQAILSSLVVSHSIQGQKLCRQDRLACVGPAKEELALALIGARNTKLSRETLSHLLAYNLDGSLGEDYNCYVLNLGRNIKLDIVSVDPKQLANSCRDRVGKIITELKRTLPDFESTGVCSTQDQIQSKIKRFLGAIAKEEKCSHEDF